MPSRHGGSRYSKVHNENYIVRIWEENVRGVLFGVLYTMTKENTLPNIFVLLSIILEFFQIIIFCFRTDYKWGGLSVDTNVNIAIIGYPAFQAVFWLVVVLVIFGTLNGIYVGYSFHKGEAISVHFLRALRWICSLIVSVLFIPIESVLITGVACDYGKSPPMLILFPERECWTGANLPVSIAGIIILIAFTAIALFTGLTYYEFDPSIINASGRLQNRFEFGSLWVKMLLVFVNYFLDSHSIVMAITVLFSSITLFVSYIVMLPAYDHKLNLVRSGSFGGVLWVSISMFIAMAINNPKNYLSIVILVAGTPFAIGLGVYAADKRFKYICNPDLVEAEPVEDGLRKSIVKKMSSTKVVKWEQPTKETKNNKLYRRLVFPTDVEIAARFVLSSKPNLALIEKAKTVYLTGLSKFPKSPSVMQGYVNFIFTVLGDWQLGYNTIEKLRKMHPLVDIQFFIYRYDKDREQRSDGSKDVGDFVRYMEFKKMHQAAKRFHSHAQVSIRKFWRKLMEAKVDVLELSDLSRDIATYQKKSSDQYLKLLELHPKNIRILRDYARFLDEIMNNERAANEMWKKADKYETRQMEKLTESHRSGGASPKNDYDYDSGSERKSEADTEQSTEFNDDTLSSASSGMAVGLAQATKDRINRLNTLSWIMFFTTLFALVYGFVQLGVVHTQLNQYLSIVQTLDGAGGVLQGNLEMGNNIVDSYTLAINTLSGEDDYLPWIGEYDQAMAKALTSTYSLENNVKSIYWGTSDAEPFTTPRLRELKLQAGYKLNFDPSLRSMALSEFNGKIPNKKRIDAFFDDSVIAGYYGSKYYDPQPADYHSTDLWSLVMLITGTMKDFAKLSIATMATTDSDVARMGNILLANIPTITSRCLDFLSLCSTLVSEKLDLVLLISLVTFVVAVALLILTAGGMYSRVVNQIFNYKVKALQMFAIIPMHIVTHMAKKKMSNLRNEGDSDASDDDSDKEEMPEKTIEQVIVKSAELPVTPAPILPKLLQLPPTYDLQAAIRDTRKTPRGSNDMEILRTPRGSELEVLKTPRGSEILRSPRGTLRTPGGSELSRTPRGFSNSQSQTLLLPNSCESRDHEEEEDEEEEEEETFKDIRDSTEIRITQGIANGIAQSSISDETPGGGIILDPVPVEYEIGSSSKDRARKGHSKKDQEIEMSDLRNKLKPNEASNSPVQPVRSFRDKLSLSLLPIIPMNRDESEQPLVAPLQAQLPKKAPKYAVTRTKTNLEASKARVTVGSLRGVVLKVHATYMFAIICLICIMLASFITTRNFVGDLEDIATDVRLSVIRTQRTYMLVHYGSLMAFPLDAIALFSREEFIETLDECYRFSYEMPAKDYQMDFLYADGECLRINKSTCPDSTYEYYDSVKYGFAQLYFTFLTTAQELLQDSIIEDGHVSTNDDTYQKFRLLAENDVYDGLAILTFSVYANAQERIAHAKKIVGIVTGISSAAFIIIHFIIFRPFIGRLRAESEYIFAILNMIPRKMLSEVPEIIEFLRREAGTDV